MGFGFFTFCILAFCREKSGHGSLLSGGMMAEGDGCEEKFFALGVDGRGRRNKSFFEIIPRYLRRKVDFSFL